MNRAATVISLVALLGFFMLYGRGVFHAAWAAAWPAQAAKPGQPGGPNAPRAS